MSMIRKSSKNFTGQRAKPRPVKDLTFTVESKTKDGSTVYFVRDNLGFICSGAHIDEASAAKTIPFIKRNLERGFIPARWLRRAKRPATAQLH